MARRKLKRISHQAVTPCDAEICKGNQGLSEAGEVINKQTNGNFQCLSASSISQVTKQESVSGQQVFQDK